MTTVRLLIVSLSLLVACSPRGTGRDTESPPANVTLDAKLMEVARMVPGFGGMFLDDSGDLTVYLVEDVDALSPDALAARAGQVERALRSIYGPELLSQGRVQRADDNLGQATAPPPRLKVVRGRYDILQLAGWRPKIDAVLQIEGVVFTDLDERNNRLRVGIAPDAPRDRVEAALAASGVPADAVVIEITPRIYQNSTLRDKVRPMPGGVQVEADTGVFSYNICTMGFNAIRAGVSGFVTNSHCTTTRGGSEGTDFHQPTDPLFGGNHVGDEIADPGYFTGGPCPGGRRCRFSDSAFVDYTVARGSNIARTTGWNNVSITISSTTPRLRIVGELSDWVDGSELDKIGRTTGWTYGRVNATCQNTNVTGTNVTLLCQHRVNRISGSHKMSDSGDSGAPVFRWLGTTVLLSGVMWGRAEDFSAFLFSPLDQVEQELGPLTTFDFPGPSPGGGMCGPGQKCCETEIINNKPVCTLCVPQSAQCP